MSSSERPFTAKAAAKGVCLLRGERNGLGGGGTDGGRADPSPAFPKAIRRQRRTHVHTRAPGGWARGRARSGGRTAAAGSMTNNSRARRGTPGNHKHFSPHYSPSLTSCRCLFIPLLVHSSPSLCLTPSSFLGGYFLNGRSKYCRNKQMLFLFYNCIIFFLARGTQVIYSDEITSHSMIKPWKQAHIAIFIICIIFFKGKRVQ